MATARRLTDEGVAAFRHWISEGAAGNPPHHLLDDPGTSAPLPVSIEIEQRGFVSRYELGAYLVDRLAPLGFATIAFDMGLWDWLTLFWFDVIAPRDADGRRSIREPARYSQDAQSRRWSRHVVRMSWLSVHNHGEHARFFLSTPLSVHTDVIEQIAGQQELFGSSAALALADRLYRDPETGGVRRGTSSKTAAGVPRRLTRFMKQIRMTYDPDLMSVDQLLGLLPQEFEVWKSPEGKPTRRKASLVTRLLGRTETSEATTR